ncbi:MAG: hypothetical protein KDF65_00700 [Anaerolineae bacterium]|nr:hypothetical protein [Anaerolineae bacterium]
MKPAKTLVPLLFILSSLACNSGISLPFIAATTATPAPVIDFAVTIVYPTATPAPVFVESTPVVTAVLTATVPLSSTDSSIQTQTVTGTVTITATAPAEPADAFTPNSLPVATPAAVLTEPVTAAPAITETTIVTATNTLTQTTPAAAPIILLEPFEAFNLQPGINELEFKWRWAAPKSCQPPDGFGYELRIWPAISGYGPMGVTDAVANQPDFFCDPKSNVVSYRVTNLKGTPGLVAVEAGQFLWDIAYIQLEPYSVVQVSGPRLFSVP